MRNPKDSYVCPRCGYVLPKEDAVACMHALMDKITVSIIMVVFGALLAIPLVKLLRRAQSYRRQIEELKKEYVW